MKKSIKIDGMSCQHCANRVEKALNGVDRITTAKVDLAAKTAYIESSSEISDNDLRNIIDEAGYIVLEISEIA